MKKTTKDVFLAGMLLIGLIVLSACGGGVAAEPDTNAPVMPMMDETPAVSPIKPDAEALSTVKSFPLDCNGAPPVVGKSYMLSGHMITYDQKDDDMPMFAADNSNNWTTSRPAIATYLGMVPHVYQEDWEIKNGLFPQVNIEGVVWVLYVDVKYNAFTIDCAPTAQ